MSSAFEEDESEQHPGDFGGLFVTLIPPLQIAWVDPVEPPRVSHVDIRTWHQRQIHDRDS